VDGARLSAFGFSALSFQLSALSSQLSAFSSQLSALSFQLSAGGVWRCWGGVALCARGVLIPGCGRSFWLDLLGLLAEILAEEKSAGENVLIHTDVF
jgi:hypothetical protein